MSKHIPGPWYLRKIEGGYRRTPKIEIRTVNSGGIGNLIASIPAIIDADDAESTAKLIAAAPAMHELLTEALDLVPRISEEELIAPALADWCRNVRAVIKATQ